MSAALALALSTLLAADASGPAITHDEVKNAVREKPLVIEAGIEDEDGVFDPVVLWRIGGEGSFSRTAMEKGGDGKYRATLDGALIVADVEYVIEAYDELGNGPSRHGTEDIPVRVRTVVASAIEEPVAPPAKPGPAPGPEEEEAGVSGLAIGVGVGAAVAVVVVVAAATAGAVVLYVLFSGGGTPGDGDVTLTVDAPSPVAGGS